MSNIIKRSAYILAGLLVVVALFLYVREGGMMDASRDKRMLSRAFDEVPIYSGHGTCDETRFDSMDNYFNYNPRFRCVYDSKEPLDAVVLKYKMRLQESGWTWARDEYLYQRAAGKRKAYITYFLKDDLRIELYATTLPDGTIWGGKQIEVSVEKISDDRSQRGTNQCDSWKGFE